MGRYRGQKQTVAVVKTPTTHINPTLGVSIRCSCGWSSPGAFGEKADEQALDAWRTHQRTQMAEDAPRRSEVIYAETVPCGEAVGTRARLLRLELPPEKGRRVLISQEFIEWNWEGVMSGYYVIEVTSGPNPEYDKYMSLHGIT